MVHTLSFHLCFKFQLKHEVTYVVTKKKDLSYFLFAVSRTPEVCYQLWWSKALCVGVNVPCGTIVAKFQSGSPSDKSWWFSAAKQLTTSYEKHPCFPLAAYKHTHATSTIAHPRPFVAAILDHPGGWIYPQTRTDAISRQVFISSTSCEMCQSDKSRQDQDEDRLLHGGNTLSQWEYTLYRNPFGMLLKHKIACSVQQYTHITHVNKWASNCLLQDVLLDAWCFLAHTHALHT